MVLQQRKVRALGLSSGGLDSILSALALREQGIDVAWITFETPFFPADKARSASEKNDIPLTVRNITPRYLEMLGNPRCGYGKNMNPCMDCHTLMFQLAGEMMDAEGYDFLFSGEVVGQRPMSQTLSSLRYVEKHSGYKGRIVRPLSIQNLPETIPEQKGLVDRTRLFNITGRSRKPQMALAEQFGVSDYPAPGGGCLLTEKVYSLRLRDLFAHQETFTENELHLLKYGRHFRLDPETKIIVGRYKKDNEGILAHYTPETDLLIKAVNIAGPLVLIPGGAGREQVLTAAGICVGYSKAPEDALMEVNVIRSGSREMFQVTGIRPSEISARMIWTQ